MNFCLFDTDFLTEIMAGDPTALSRLASIPVDQRATTIITVEEIIAGRLADVRRAEGRQKRLLVRAYELLCTTFIDLRRLPILPYDQEAHRQYERLRPVVKRKVGVHDLRIAAIAMSLNATVITRNRQDFQLIPDLSVEYWP